MLGMVAGNSEGFYCDCGSASGEAVPWGAKGDVDGGWHCRAMNGVPPATVIHQFFPQPAYQVLDALQADTDSELVFLGTAAASPSKLRNGACHVSCVVCTFRQFWHTHTLTCSTCTTAHAHAHHAQ